MLQAFQRKLEHGKFLSHHGDGSAAVGFFPRALGDGIEPHGAGIVAMQGMQAVDTPAGLPHTVVISARFVEQFTGRHTGIANQDTQIIPAEGAHHLLGFHPFPPLTVGGGR